MFAQKIDSIEEQIRQLQQQQAKYKNLHTETLNALALITQIQQQAAELGEADTVAIAFLEALQIQSPPETPSTTEADLQTEIEEDLTEQVQDNECVEEKATFDDPYSTPEELAAALKNEDEDGDTILMGIANVLDCAPATEIEGRVWYFVQHLPLESCDRIIPYLPKSIVPEWRKQMEIQEQEARASLFPATVAVTTNGYEPQKDDIVECLSNGMVGRVTYVCDSPNGRTATVLVPGGASNFHVSNLKYISKHQEEPTATDEPPVVEDPEVDELARLCLKQKAWSQIRLFAESNPKVIIRMQELASSKTEKRIIHNLPSLVLGYIQRANDRSDLEWLPEQILTEVEALLTQPQQQSIA